MRSHRKPPCLLESFGRHATTWSELICSPIGAPAGRALGVVLLAAFLAYGLSLRGMLWGVGGLLVMGLAGLWHLTRARRTDYESGSWLRVERAIERDVRYGEASPALNALALVGVGDFASARRTLLRPPRGAADEDREISLCTRALIAAFEGRVDPALCLCKQLVDLPFDPRRSQRQRRAARRAGVIAIARALAGTADELDYEELRVMAAFEPALYWPCRYGAALSCCARDDAELASRLLSHAPSWPRESAFCALHERILRRAEQQRSARARDLAVANL